MKKPRKQPDLHIYWTNRDGNSPNVPGGGDFAIRWTAHPGCSQTAGLLLCTLTDIKTAYGTTLLEELDKRGYDLKTLKLSIRRKEGV